MKYTEEQLKRALVEALPDRLSTDVYLETMEDYFFWTEKGSQVTEHEWPAIVGMVEDDLTREQHADYMMLLTSSVKEIRDVFKWQIRTEALINIGFLKL